MVDYLHRNTPCFRLVKWARCVAVECGPCVFVNLCLESSLERFIWIIGPEEVGVANEETLLVVVGVDEPAGDAVWAVTADFASIGMKDIYTVDLDLDFDPSAALIMSISGSPKMTKRLPLPVFLRSSAICKSAFILALSIGMWPRWSNSEEWAS